MDDDSQASRHQKIDWFDATTVTAFVTAFVCDLLFFLIIPHYFGALIAIPIIWPKTRGFLAKAMLVLAFILPLPVLTIGIWLAIFLSNKAFAFIAEQAAIVTVAAFTAGGGLALEGVAAGGEVAAGGIEAAGVVAEAGGAVAETAEVGGAIGETGVEGATATEGGAEAGERAGEETVEKPGESLRDRVTRKLEEKIRERSQEGFGGEGEEKKKPTEEEVVAEMEKQEQLEEAMGATPPPLPELERELFAERVPVPQGGAALPNEDAVARDRPRSNVIPMSPRQPRVSNSTQDVIAKSRAREAEFERNRDTGGNNDDNQDLPRAA